MITFLSDQCYQRSFTYAERINASQTAVRDDQQESENDKVCIETLEVVEQKGREEARLDWYEWTEREMRLHDPNSATSKSISR